MEALLDRFSKALQTAVDGVEQVARAPRESDGSSAAGANGNGNGNHELSLFLSRLEELEESVEYSERLYERTAPSMKELLRVGRDKAAANRRLLQAIAQERGVALPEALPHEADDPGSPTGGGSSSRALESPAASGSGHTPRAGFATFAYSTAKKNKKPPLPTPSRNTSRHAQSMAAADADGGAAADDDDSDPKTPTLEDYGLQHRIDEDFGDALLSDEDEDEEREPAPVATADVAVSAASAPAEHYDMNTSLLSESGAPALGGGALVVEEDLSGVPAYLRPNVDVASLNLMLEWASTVPAPGFGIDDVEALDFLRASQSKAALLVLVQLGKLRHEGANLYTFQNQ